MEKYARWIEFAEKHDIIKTIKNEASANGNEKGMKKMLREFSYIHRLRALREENNLTQSRVATVLETSQTMYARYERGANELPIRHLIRLSLFYGVSTDYILGLSEKRKW